MRSITLLQAIQGCNIPCAAHTWRHCPTAHPDGDRELLRQRGTARPVDKRHLQRAAQGEDDGGLGGRVQGCAGRQGPRMAQNGPNGWEDFKMAPNNMWKICKDVQNMQQEKTWKTSKYALNMRKI